MKFENCYVEDRRRAEDLIEYLNDNPKSFLCNLIAVPAVQRMLVDLIGVPGLQIPRPEVLHHPVTGKVITPEHREKFEEILATI